MASTKKTQKKDESKKSRKLNINHFKALGWTVFAVHQGFMSWLILTNFNNYFAVASAVASFGMAVVAIAMVGACFTRAK